VGSVTEKASMTDDWRERLNELARGNEEYAEFNRRIVNTSQRVLGVRMPDLRQLARSLARDLDFAAAQKFIKFASGEVYEEVLLCGLIINYAKLTAAEKIKLTRQFLKYVDNWAAVDCCAARLPKGPTLRQERDLWWEFALECLDSTAEFTARYGVVLLMTNSIDPFSKNLTVTASKAKQSSNNHLDYFTSPSSPELGLARNDSNSLSEVFAALRRVRHDGYYVKMALAWLYATAAVKYFDQTLAEINRPGLDVWTRRKALTKMLESYRFTPEQKTQIREFRGRI
jgi:3-methyladenine DNA glycosylase AlkD